MNTSKIVTHYLAVSQRYRDGLIKTEELQDIMHRDAQAFLSMKNSGVVTKEEYDSILVIVSEFEEMFDEISALKEDLEERQN